MGVNSFSSGFGKNYFHVLVVKIVVDCAGCVTASAHAGNKIVGIALACVLRELVFDFRANHRLQSRNHVGIGMRSYS